MKAFFKSNKCSAMKSEHRHNAHLKGQLVVIDCTDIKQVVRVDLFIKGSSCYSCLWITRGDSLNVMGSGKAKSLFGAVYAALESAGISFDEDLPEIGYYCDFRVWDRLERYFAAIAATAGVKTCYFHNCLRSY